MSGWQYWVWALPIPEEHRESGICVLYFGCGGVGGDWGEWVGCLGQAWEGGVVLCLYVL